MSTFPPLTLSSGKSAPVSGEQARPLWALLLVSLGLLAVSGRTAAGQQPASARPARAALRPFLEEFRATHAVKLVEQPVQWPSALGTEQGWLARPDGAAQLPALLLVTADPQAGDVLRKIAHDFAPIGYVTLVIRLDRSALPDEKVPDARDRARERTLAVLSSAVRWLQQRDDVMTEAVGVLGWSEAGEAALELAATHRLRGCVVCGGPLPRVPDAALAGRLRHTPVLIAYGTAALTPAQSEHLARWRSALRDAAVPPRIVVAQGVNAAFLAEPPADAQQETATEQAWFEVYEFFDECLEEPHPEAHGAPGQPVASGQHTRAFATIADLMRAVNSTEGPRGQLAQSLAEPPADEAAWRTVRARAALVVETAGLLASRRPKQGSAASWRQQTAAYGNAAASLAAAAEKHDFASASGAMKRLNAACAACHANHR